MPSASPANEHLLLNMNKMFKSAGNFVTLLQAVGKIFS